MSKKVLSNKRAISSAITLADILTKEGASIIPGGGLVYDLSKALFTHGKKYYDDRCNLRLEDFHEKLLNNENEILEEFINKKFDIEDYNSLLSSSIQDIEQEKTKLYALLLRGLIINNININEKRHFITALKNLTLNDIDYLRKFEINSHYDMMEAGGIQDQKKQIIDSSSGLRKVSLDKNILYGFIHAKQGEEANITPLGKHLLSLLFEKSDLKPNALGKRAWTGFHTVVVSYELNKSVQADVCTTISSALSKNRIKSEICILDKYGEATQLGYHFGILVIGSNNISSEYLPSIKKYSDHRPLLRVNTLSSSKEIKINNVKFIDTIDINFNDKSKANSLLEQLIKEKILKS